MYTPLLVRIQKDRQFDGINTDRPILRDVGMSSFDFALQVLALKDTFSGKDLDACVDNICVC